MTFPFLSFNNVPSSLSTTPLFRLESYSELVNIRWSPCPTLISGAGVKDEFDGKPVSLYTKGCVTRDLQTILFLPSILL